MDRVNDGVADDGNALSDALAGEIVTVARSRSKVQRRDLTGQLAVHFLRERRIFVVGAQTSLNMADRNFVVERCECAGKGGRGIAVDENNVRLRLFEHLIQTVQALFGDGSERLTRLHDIQVIIRPDAENIKNLIEHFAMLCGNAHDGLGVFVLLKRMHERSHFDSFRARTEYSHYLDFIHVCFSPPVQPLFCVFSAPADACPSVPRRR